MPRTCSAMVLVIASNWERLRPEAVDEPRRLDALCSNSESLAIVCGCGWDDVRA